MTDLSCPVCGTELSPAQLFADADAQQAFARLAAVSIPLGARVLQYLTLFTPPKTKLTLAKQCKLLLQLLPDLERQAITAQGRDWPVPLLLWAQAFEQLQASRQAGRLELPLRGHGYLHAVLVGLSGKQTPGAPASPAPAPARPVQRDPELLRLEAHASRATPMPEHLRQRLAAAKAHTPSESDPAP